MNDNLGGRKETGMRRSRLRVALLGVSTVALLLLLPAAFAGVLLPPGGSFYDDDTNIHEGNIEAIAAENITRAVTLPTTRSTARGAR